MPERHDPAVLGELLGLLAHDLRNPLSALHSNLGFLRSLMIDAELDAREALDDGVVSCDGLAHIIDNIDLLGQALRDAPPPEGSAIDLPSVVSDVASASRSMAQSHGVEIHVAPSATIPVTVQGSREFIGRALTNLVRNSIQHSPSGGKVRISTRTEGGDRAVVVVDDTGVSLAESTDSFTALGQIDSKAVPNGRYSRGLGLYAAAIAALAGRATVRTAAPPAGARNAFELVLSRSG